jgi:hypothetical protein
VKTDLATALTLFPQPEDIPRLTIAFMQMMMAHPAFEREVRILQSSVTKDPNFGEQRNNQWSADKRPNRMAKLIEEKLGQIPETKAIKKLLKDARVPSDKRNELVHGTWWRFDPRTATITVRCGSQRKNKDQFAEYSEERIWTGAIREAPMRILAATALLAFCLVATPATAQAQEFVTRPVAAVLAETAPPDRSKTAGPISAELAKKCRALAIKAHPTKPAGSKNGAYAQAQRDYFQDCIAKGGNMPD